MAAVSFENFDLLIEPLSEKDARYRARVLNSPAGQANLSFTIPLTSADIEEFHRLLEQKETTSDNPIRRWGTRLFDALFHSQIDNCLRVSLTVGHSDQKGLRILLRLPEDPLLWSLPWEYLYDSANKRFLTLSNQTPIVRCAELSRPIEPLTVPRPLKVLVVSDKQNTHQVEEWKQIQACLATAIAADQVHLAPLHSKNLHDLQSSLRRDCYHVLHLAGGEGFYHDEKLGILLHDHPSLRLVVLTGNTKRQPVPYHATITLAQYLLSQSVPAIIAAHLVEEAAVITFVREFYKALVDNYPVDAAVAEARKALVWNNERVWGIPTLHMYSLNGELFHFAQNYEIHSASAPTAQVGNLVDAPETNQVVTVINTSGGAYIAGNVQVGGNFVGRDTLPALLQEMVSDGTAVPVTAQQPTEQQIHRWPSLWSKQRPYEKLEVTQWLQLTELKFNPFGPESAELDPYLPRYSVYPAIADGHPYGPRPSVIWGKSGSGKTATALLLAHDCITPTFSPREPNTYPIYCSLSDAILVQSRTYTELLAHAIAESFIPFLIMNTSVFLEAKPTQKAAILACLVYGAGSFENLTRRLEQAGLPDRGIGAVLLSELLTQFQQRPALQELANVAEDEWLQIFAQIRPPTYQNTYLILDLTDRHKTAIAPKTFSTFFAPMLAASETLANRQVYLKWFLPAHWADHLSIPEKSQATLQWSSEQLMNLLVNRINLAVGHMFDFRQLFTLQFREANLTQRLVDAADGSPQRLIRLGNRLLQEHVAQRSDEAELTYRDLEAALAAADLDE